MMNISTDDVRQNLFDKQIEYGFFRLVDCSDDENAKYSLMKRNGESLPERVRQYKDPKTDKYVDRFYYLIDSKLSDSERLEYLRYLELERIETIKNCVVFFTVLAVVSMILGLIAAFI